MSAGVGVGILGTVRLAVDGREVLLRSAKQRVLLGTLAVDVGRIVSTDRLADLLWGDDQPRDPSGAVHTHVSRLRALIHRHGAGDADQLLATRPPGYALLTDPEQVDAGRFERLVDEARAALSPAVAAELLQDALGLWRGPALAELDDERARSEAARLSELHTVACELHADALLALGRHGDAAGELRAALARHPLREGLSGRLMVALARSGRQAEALAVYRDLRRRLVGDLGVEPSELLRRLERAILQQAEDLPWPLPGRWAASPVDVRPPEGSPDGATSPLPASLTSFVGRQEELRQVCAAVRAGRVVVLTGVGGVGKSRLALQVAERLAHDYPDGVALCDLTATTDPAAVAGVVASTLGVLPTGGADPHASLVGLLRSQRRLLVLDNCEHVLAGASELAAGLAQGCPEVDVLATSRLPLDVPGQQIWPVEPLPVGAGRDADVVALFRDRAVAVDPTTTLTAQDREVVGQICQRLDGLPLAIELAAARTRAMTPADILERLDDRFVLLTDSPRVAASRHRDLEAVVAWSAALLPEATRRLFHRCAIFSGGFDLGAAEQVCAGDGLAAAEVAARLAELVDHSLVVVERPRRQVRYRLLETLRAYGRARLGPELGIWQRRHAEHFTATAEEAALGLLGLQEARWMQWVDTELANLRAAHGWAVQEALRDKGTERAERRADATGLALRLSAALGIAAFHGLRDELHGWAVRAVQLPEARRHPAYPGALIAAGLGWMQRGDLDQAQLQARRALTLAGDGGAALRAHRLLAEVALYQGRLEATARLGQVVIDQAGATGRLYDQALGHLYRVHAAAYAGRTAEAAADLRAGREAAHRTGAPSLKAAFRYLEGEVVLDADPDTALPAFEEAVALAETVGNRFVAGIARVAEASLLARHGPPEKALAAFRAIIDQWRRSGDWAHMWTTLRNLLVLLERIGAPQPAAVLLGAVETASTGAPAFGEDAIRLASARQAVRASLGEAGYAEADGAGRRMDDDQAVVYALAVIDDLLA